MLLRRSRSLASPVQATRVLLADEPGTNGDKQPHQRDDETSSISSLLASVFGPWHGDDTALPLDLDERSSPPVVITQRQVQTPSQPAPKEQAALPAKQSHPGMWRWLQQALGHVPALKDDKVIELVTTPHSCVWTREPAHHYNCVQRVHAPSITNTLQTDAGGHTAPSSRSVLLRTHLHMDSGLLQNPCVTLNLQRDPAKGLQAPENPYNRPVAASWLSWWADDDDDDDKHDHKDKNGGQVPVRSTIEPPDLLTPARFMFDITRQWIHEQAAKERPSDAPPLPAQAASAEDELAEDVSRRWWFDRRLSGPLRNLGRVAAPLIWSSPLPDSFSAPELPGKPNLMVFVARRPIGSLRSANFLRSLGIEHVGVNVIELNTPADDHVPPAGSIDVASQGQGMLAGTASLKGARVRSFDFMPEGAGDFTKLHGAEKAIVQFDALNPQEWAFVGYSSATLDDIKRFNTRFRIYELGSSDCRDYASQLVEHLTGKYIDPTYITAFVDAQINGRRTRRGGKAATLGVRAQRLHQTRNLVRNLRSMNHRLMLTGKTTNTSGTRDAWEGTKMTHNPPSLTFQRRGER